MESLVKQNVHSCSFSIYWWQVSERRVFATNTCLRMTHAYRQLPHPLPAPLLNKTIVKNLRTFEERVELQLEERKEGKHHP